MTLVAISQDGSLMSTVEVKQPEEGIGGLVCLKFWALGSENKKFSLSTVIYEPHRLALAYIPENSEIFYQEGGYSLRAPGAVFNILSLKNESCLLVNVPVCYMLHFCELECTLCVYITWQS